MNTEKRRPPGHDGVRGSDEEGRPVQRQPSCQRGLWVQIFQLPHTVPSRARAECHPLTVTVTPRPLPFPALRPQVSAVTG